MEEYRWVALLRAINLGTRNKVSMTELRAVLEEARCSSARTYIRSGNVLFRSASRDRCALARDLERAIELRFGVSTTVVLRSFAELRTMVTSHPFGPDTAHTMVAFLAERPAAARVRALRALDVAPDRATVKASDVFLHLPNGVQGAKLSGAVLERQLGVPATVRTWRTVAALARMTEEAT